MLLLSHGANISTVNTEGHTPKSLASAQVKHLLEGKYTFLLIEVSERQSRNRER